MQEIFVTNKNDFHHTDRYAGVDYDFPPGEKVCVPADAAVLMFGFQCPDKNDALVRQGWANQIVKSKDPKTGKQIEVDAGLEKLRKFVFTKAVMVEAPIQEAVAA